MRLNERAMLPTSSREWTGSRALRSPVAARAIASFTRRTGRSTMRESSRLRSRPTTTKESVTPP